MVKIDIISGFLGAGKTTLIKKLLKDGFQGEQVVLIENEFGDTTRTESSSSHPELVNFLTLSKLYRVFRMRLTSN